MLANIGKLDNNKQANYKFKKDIMQKLLANLTLVLVFLFSFSCSNEYAESEILNSNKTISMTNAYSKTSSENQEFSLEEIKQMAENHNIYLERIHDEYGDIVDYTEAQSDEVLRNYVIELGFTDEEEIQKIIDFKHNVNSVNSFKDILTDETEKNYVDLIDQALESSINVEDLEAKINVVENQILSEKDGEIYKTPLLIYAETIKSSAFYWAPVNLGGSGKGTLILANRGNNQSQQWRKVAQTDGRALAVGFTGMAIYGAWGVLFGPVGFALTGASVAFVVVNAGLASALHAAAGG